MTDKVQKIRAFLVGIADADGVSTILAKAIEKKILPYIDSLQEEPVAPKVLEDMLNAKTAAESLGISQEEHDRIVDELIYGKEPELVDVDDLPNKEEEPASEIILEGANFNKSWYAHPELAFKAGAKWQKEKDQKK